MTENPVSRRLILAAALSLVPAAARAQNSSRDALGGFLNQLAPPNRGTAAPPGASAPGAAAIPGGPGAAGARLSENEIGLGLKDALKVATRRVVGRVGRPDGYNADPAIRIPLPGPVQQFEGPVRALGASPLLDDLRLKMNRAAEQAAPKALDIFVDATSRMSFEDARGILSGPQDSATQYFRRTTSEPLTRSFRPIVNTALSGTGAVVAMNTLQTRARGIPLVGAGFGNFDLTDFTVGKALDGLFHYLAVEEAAIRTNPVARSTDLLRRVFG